MTVLTVANRRELGRLGRLGWIEAAIRHVLNAEDAVAAPDIAVGNDRAFEAGNRPPTLVAEAVAIVLAWHRV